MFMIVRLVWREIQMVFIRIGNGLIPLGVDESQISSDGVLVN